MERAVQRRTLLALGAATITSLLAGCASTRPSPPVVVLVHGAWMGASAWDRVAAELRAQGFEVVAVELPGHGRDTTPPERLSLAGYVDAVLATIPPGRKAVLVGHSMAGMVISAAAEKAPEQVQRLVYVAAYLPRNGESLYQLSMTDADSHVGKYWMQADPKAYSPASIRSDGIAEVFCADCSEGDKALLVKTHRAEAVPPLGTPVNLTAARFGRVPRTYIHTTRDNAVSYRLQQTMVANAGGAPQVFTLDTSHAPMLSQPKALAALIAKAAQ